jgi:SNF2 family DNA or RNA helicase
MQPTIITIDLSLPVVPLAIELATAFQPPGMMEVSSRSFADRDQPPQVISLKVPSTTPRIFRFTFPEAPIDSLAPRNTSPPLLAAPSPPPAATASDPPNPKPTRIRPPGDIIKLEDRLYYLLQPPLETLLASDALHFPFEPFPYQYHGVAFLYPRYSAVLADEMGLGKTMQAITAVRMLLRSGEIRSALLVCPKPLVTNWRREFQLWAPEIPLAIIEGDAAKRRWQWMLADAPVKIANYELLMRDRDVLDEAPPLDLVVLDEAQRIKNSSSTTSQIVRAIRRARNWALTGTPIENSPDDLVGIFEFLSPGYLRPGTPPRRMAELVRDHILRRTKEMVLADLPPKMFRDAELDLSCT